MTGALAMGTNKITGLGTATASTDALSRSAGDARYLLESGDTATGWLLSDQASGGKFEARSTSLRAFIYPEEANGKTFIASMARSTADLRPMEFQASSYYFQYGNVEIPYSLGVGGDSAFEGIVTFGSGLVTSPIRFWCASYISRWRAQGSAGFYATNDTGTLIPVHASSFPTSLANFQSENVVPHPALFTAQPTDEEPTPSPEVDLVTMVALLYDALMSLPGGADALQDAVATRVSRAGE